MKIKLITAIVLGALVMTVSACGAPNAGTDSSGAATVQSEETVEEAAAEETAVEEAVTEEASSEETAVEETAAGETAADDNAQEESASAAGNGSDTIVIYFSRMGITDYPDDVDVVSSASLLKDGDTLKGNAQVMAEWIAEETGGDLFEILTVKKYAADYNECITDARQEKNENARPELANTLTGLENYGTVHFVFPNWWGDLPMAVYTFFDTYDFSGKHIIASCTHGGSRFSGTIQTIGSLEPGATVTEGIEIYADDVAGAREDVIGWVNGLE